MNTNIPNLYTAFGLDRNEDSNALALSLSARDLRLEQMGIPQNDPRRTQTVQAFSVLADPQKRATYDAKLDLGIPLTWGQIQHLGNFGTLPADTAAPRNPQPFAQPQATTNGYVFGDPTVQAAGQAFNPLDNQVHSAMYGQTPFSPTPASFAGQSYGMMNSTSERPTSSTRLLMAILDMFIAGFVGSMVMGFFAYVNESLMFIVGVLFMAFYIIGAESVWGATPAKKLMGYEVRDVTTHSRLSAGAAAKRNWWKVISVVPGVGGIVSFIMAIVYGSSIKPENEMRGIHDRLANAEVVKKQR
ncbi:RDD family protein [Corynebacterium callunae]|uniref:RDD family protein n=1 Tax=Corynebacterium callunae TaxID=1721 RepID=UPI001FFE3A1E|nr:RDD family protein [Corynebacterium callunae]MCK2201065.1 RDD family protein [Corynebacterium callunae]